MGYYIVTKCKYFFVTGTDTNVGKTTVSCAILKHASSNGYKVIGCKPVSSGAELINNKFINRDVLELILHSSVKFSYEEINPLSFIKPTAPCIANIYEKKVFNPEILSSCIKNLKKYSDLLIIEGVGGWFAPIDKGYLYSEWVVQEKLPVILVVGIKLGCINHALLTEREIMKSGTKLIGWIANYLDNSVYGLNHYINILKNHLKSRLLGIVLYNKEKKLINIENYIDIMLI